MTEETPTEQPEIKKKKLTPQEKQEQHIQRIKRTAIACFMGIIAGVISFLVVPPGQVTGLSNYLLLAIFIMLAGVVVQRHLFVLLKLNKPKLGNKDWVFQGFMTFAFWFITWSLLLSNLPR
jgi:heme/copper-type cytochrome/quinol oxidase subunit 4